MVTLSVYYTIVAFVFEQVPYSIAFNLFVELLCLPDGHASPIGLILIIVA